MTTIVTNASAIDIVTMGGDPTVAVDIMDVQTLTTREASITKILVKIQDDIVEITGTSKRSPEDPYDSLLGAMLSTQRAYANLAKRIAKRTSGLVDHYDNIRQMRPAQLERSKQWKNHILRVASSDDSIQRAALRLRREEEGTWAAPQAQAQPVK